MFNFNMEIMLFYPRFYKLMLLLVVILLAFSFIIFKFPFSLAAPERVSPNDWVREEQIKVYKDKVVLEIPNALWAGFTNTNSMDPFLDERSNAVEIKPSNPEAIKVGDVIAYDSPYGTLIHRVVEKGHDQQGIYYRVKGDNSTITDPMKVRFEQVEGVVVAVIY